MFVRRGLRITTLALAQEAAFFGLMANFGQGPVPASRVGDGQGNEFAEPINPLVRSISRVVGTSVPEPRISRLVVLAFYAIRYVCEDVIPNLINSA
jgi:hypothetical protein